MSDPTKLLVIAIEATAEGLRAQALEAYDRSRKIRDRDGTENEEDGDDYELGFAEGRHLALNTASERLSNLARALGE
jgi:hypothetical protein